MRSYVILLFMAMGCLLGISARSQSLEFPSGVECRLSLVQAVPNQPGKGLALGFSVINHSDQDVYIPNLTFAYGKVHLYEIDGDSLKELDLMNQHDDMFIHHPQDLSKYFEAEIKETRAIQDSILKQYCDLYHLPYKEWKIGQPLFLKAHQEIKYLSVDDMDFLLTPGKEYVFSFKPQILGIQYAPEHIMGYQRIDQYQLKANTLYYETMNP